MRNVQHINAYKELIAKNNEPRFLWWLVSNLAEVDSKVEEQIANRSAITNSPELEQLLFGFIGRASTNQLEEFNTLWFKRIREVTACRN